MTDLTWTPALDVVGKSAAVVSLIPSQTRMRAMRHITLDPETRTEDVAVALSQLFHEVRIDPPGELHDIAERLWGQIDARDRPKPA